MSNSKYFFAKNITKMAIFTALSFVLYMFVKFPLPIFPQFLELQISDLPALLSGFMMGPLAGSIVIVLRTLLKLPSTSTAGVGELADLLIGLAFVLTSACIYKRNRSLKGAIVGLIVGIASTTLVAVVANRFILIPFFSTAYGFDVVIGMVKAIFPSITDQNFYAFYLLGAVVPFNLLRSVLCAIICFLLYKRLEKLFDKMFKATGSREKQANFLSKSEKDTYNFAKSFARNLVGGEVITLSGEMGVGKTVFAKGLADGLGVKEDVLSPTYTIMNEYESGRLKLYHYDAYRLTSGDEAVETGLADYFGEKGGVCLIEWAENVRSALPTGLIKIEIKYTGENLREITVNDK